MVAQADATIYGDFELRLVSKDSTNNELDVESDDFRIGLKGDVDLGLEGTKGLFGYEMEMNPEDQADAGTTNQSFRVRKAFVGATGSWGTALIGQIANPAEAVVGKTANVSEGFAEDLTPDFLGQAVAYVSPTMSGFNAYAGAVVSSDDNAAADDATADIALIGGNYNVGDFGLSAAYWTLNDTTGAGNDTDWYGIAGSYTIGNTYLALGHQSRGDDTNETDVVSAKVAHSIDALTLYVTYDDLDHEGTGWAADNTKMYDSEAAVGAVYKLGSQAALDVEFVSQEGDVATTADNDIFSIGYEIKF
jgi:predicted porin